MKPYESMVDALADLKAQGFTYDLTQKMIA